ncbi:hypothetical protein FB645_002260 [Coemansia sp. IMI 203386]|nr:hypothetical protein FB645_002260 [Coemansia sp. IMI 203386]
MDWQYADSTRSTERPATIACTTETASVVPLSDIGDWSDNHGTPWNAYGLRRMRSWMTGAVSNNRLPTLPAWLGIETIGSYIAPRTWQRRKSTNSDISVANTCSTNNCSECTNMPSKKCIDDVVVYEEEKPSLVVVSEDQKKKQKRELMSVFQVPEYMVEDYIWDSYRPLCFSYRECLRSWGYVHSELGNILTHAGGAAIFVVLALITGPVIIPLLTTDQPHRSAAAAADYAIVYVYIAAVLFCLLASVAFHTLSCHSRHTHFSSLRCDFIGILTLIVGSFIPVGYYAFLHASYGILVGYMAMFVGIGVVGVAASVLGRVEDPKRAGWRPVIFMAIAGSGLAPVIHGSVLHGYKGAVDRISLWYVITMALLYIAGTALYAFKIPERYRPGKHNVFMHSHQIFHVFVVLAAVCHYVGILRALSWAHRI